MAEVTPLQVEFISEETTLPDGSENLASSADKETGDNVGAFVQQQFQTAHDSRRNAQEDILLDAERAYRNKYSMPAQTELSKRQQESGDSTVFVPFTRTKVNIAVAKTYEKMLNTSDNPWSVQPDELSPQEEQRNMQDVMQGMQSGLMQEEPQSALQKLNEFSGKENAQRCEAMEVEIAEQMNKGNVFSALSKTILQQHYLGTGVAKFEITTREETKWVQSQFGWNLETTELPFPRVVFISIFDMFFDPYALNRDSMRYAIQRHVIKHSDMNNYKDAQDFKEGIIKQVLLENTDGNHVNLDYETTIRGVNEQDQNERGSEGYFDVFEYWGEMAGDKLIEMGMDDVEETKSYNVECWTCAGHTIKLVVNPHTPQKIPYFIVPYQENTHTIYATGIAEDLFGVQDVLNSVTRATIDNAAFSHGPMCEFNVDMLKSGETPPDVLKPRQVVLREGGDPKDPMVRYYQPTENSGVLNNVYQMFSQIGEDATGISSSTEESLPSANSPNMAVSMSLSQKNILQRTVVANIDYNLIKPMIEMYYNFNMEWSDKEDIKASAHITANGVTSIIAKEMRSQQLMAFAQMTQNEMDAGLVDRKELLSEVVTSLDQDEEKLLLSERQTAENNQANTQAQQQAAQMEQQGVINQINAENEGEMKQEGVKGDIAMRKQKLIENSKMAQLLAKEQGQIDANEFELFKQFQLMQQGQVNDERNMALGQANNERSAMQGQQNSERSAQQNQTFTEKNNAQSNPNKS